MISDAGPPVSAFGASELVALELGETALRAERMTFSHSGNVIFSVRLTDREVVLRTTTSRNRFVGSNQNLLAVTALGLPAPKLIKSDTGFERYPFAFQILEKIPGTDLLYELPTMTESQIRTLAEQITDYESRLNSLPEGSAFGWGNVGEGGAQQRWLDVFWTSAETRGQAQQGSEERALWRRIDAQVERLQGYFDAIRPTCFLEDLTTKNVIVKDGKLQGVIDFDCVCFGDPLWVIGLTAGCIVNDIGAGCLSYAEALCRLRRLTVEQRSVVDLYSAIRALTFARDEEGNTAEPERQSRLFTAADQWLGASEQR